MPSGPIDPSPESKYVVTGRVVTMAEPEVIERGAVYIEGGSIAAVQDEDRPAPAGFADVPRLATGDTIYPGLIELHNHLSYNAIPLWDVPERYTNNGQWRNHPDYPRLITKPAQVLGRTDRVAQALVRYVECRALLGGVTTSQGITLSSAQGVRKFFKGIVRNVEQTDEADLPEAGTRISNPSRDGAEDYLRILETHTAYLQHLSEGVDETARGWFLALRLGDGGWALGPAFCGIHGTALSEEDLRIIHEHGGSLVWSPLSNYLLYGDTLDIEAAQRSGILMGVGSDWAPSGSKNLLGELKVAWLASRAHGDVFAPQELVAMATANAARILKWDGVLGTIQPGKRADLVCINGQQGDDYVRLLEARETSVTLVIINGTPRVGQTRLMQHLDAEVETLGVGRSERQLYLRHTLADELLGAIGLGEAIEVLTDALERLPELAEQLDQGVAEGFFSGSLEGTPGKFRVHFDYDDDLSALELSLGAADLASLVGPMALDPITVADDGRWFRRLMAARNLPDFVKTGLPTLHGEPVPRLEDRELVSRDASRLPAEVYATAAELRGFLRKSGELSRDQLRAIVDQGLLVLQENYVHLPLKRAMYAADPVQRLRLLRYRLEETGSADESSSEVQVHQAIADAFLSLRDLHTTYRLPRPFRGKVAFLPFLVEEFWWHAERRYLVSKLIGDPGPESFRAGVELLYWNGMPIHNAVLRNAAHQGGGNEWARLARGLDSLTIRPIAHGVPTDEEWVQLVYRDDEGSQYEHRQDWLIFEPRAEVTGVDPEASTAQATALCLDADTEDVRHVKKLFFAGAEVVDEEEAGRGRTVQPLANVAEGVPTHLPTVFRARPVDTRHGRYGLVRIFTFNVADANAFVDEFVRLVEQLPQAGLILDARGNPGGLIHAAERLLQVLTPGHIQPQSAQFINTPLNLRLCRQHAPSAEFSGLTLAPWVKSIAEAVMTGATFSLGFPLTDPDACNAMGQRYFGPSILITDALCYSATDIFAAGFQDHGIGPVLGVHPNTGAGGANVWSHVVLRKLAQGTEEPPYQPLPGGADLRVAVRRTIRVGKNAGSVVEDLGVLPDAEHRMSRRDVMQHNVDLIEAAARILAGMPRYVLSFALEREGESAVADIDTGGLDRVEAHVDGRAQGTFEVRDGANRIPLSRLMGGRTGGGQLELRGFAGGQLAIARRVELPGESRA